MSQTLPLLIAESLELETGLPDSEEQLVLVLADQIRDMMSERMDFLLSALYRMDVAESDVQLALQPDAPEWPALGIARLILERQKRRLATKAAFKKGQASTNWWEAEF